MSVSLFAEERRRSICLEPLRTRSLCSVGSELRDAWPYRLFGSALASAMMVSFSLPHLALIAAEQSRLELAGEITNPVVRPLAREAEVPQSKP